MSKTIPTTFAQDFIPGNVKAAMGAAGASSGDLWRVPFDQLYEVPGLNVRTKTLEYEEHVNRIAKSIFDEGYYQDKPLAVFIDEQGRICVKDGYSRVEATRRAIAMGAQIATLPAVTSPKGTTMTDIMIGLVKSNTGKPLLPIEVAVVCKRLTNWGWESKIIAERMDYTTQYVNDLLGLIEAPAALQELVSAGKASASTAIKQIKKEGVAKATETLVEASKSAPEGKVSAKTLKAAAGEFTMSQLKSIIEAVYANEAAFLRLPMKLQSRILEVAVP